MNWMIGFLTVCALVALAAGQRTMYMHSDTVWSPGHCYCPRHDTGNRTAVPVFVTPENNETKPEDYWIQVNGTTVCHNGTGGCLNSSTKCVKFGHGEKGMPCEKLIESSDCTYESENITLNGTNDSTHSLICLCYNYTEIGNNSDIVVNGTEASHSRSYPIVYIGTNSDFNISCYAEQFTEAGGNDTKLSIYGNITVLEAYPSRSLNMTYLCYKNQELYKVFTYVNVGDVFQEVIVPHAEDEFWYDFFVGLMIVVVPSLAFGNIILLVVYLRWKRHKYVKTNCFLLKPCSTAEMYDNLHLMSMEEGTSVACYDGPYTYTDDEDGEEDFFISST